MNIWLLALYVACCCGASNFVYQSLNDQFWDVAFERTFFQFAAILIFVIVFKVVNG